MPASAEALQLTLEEIGVVIGCIRTEGRITIIQLLVMRGEGRGPMASTQDSSLAIAVLNVLEVRVPTVGVAPLCKLSKFSTKAMSRFSNVYSFYVKVR